MNSFLKKVFCVLPLFGMVAFAHADDDDRGSIGFEVGAFFPTDSEVRDVFGDVLPKFGLAYVSSKRPKNGRIATEFSIVRAEDGDDEFFLLPVTVGLEFAQGNEDSKTLPYGRVGVGVAYLDYSFDRGADRISTKRLSPAASAEIGAILNDRTRIYGRYSWIAEADDINFSGLQVGITFAFFKL